MNLVRGLSALVVVAILLSTSVAAVWQWENYEGVSRWSLKITENEQGCGGDVETDTRTIDIKHNFKTADVGDFGHGEESGTFAGNVLSAPDRTIRDGSGMAKLIDLAFVFDADCLGFEGKYSWDYWDSRQQCSGWTNVVGTNLDKRCPEQTKLTTIMDIRKDPVQTSREAQYAARLKENPKDFWANWDMAELKKKQGNYDAYFRYFDDALSNEKITPDTREKMKVQQLELLHLTERPSPAKSPILRMEGDELKNWKGGKLYDTNYPKPAVFDFESFKLKLWAKISPKGEDIVNKVVGVPEE